MRNIEPYPNEERKRVIRDYLQSGVITYKYSKRSEAAVKKFDAQAMGGKAFTNCTNRCARN